MHDHIGLAAFRLSTLIVNQNLPDPYLLAGDQGSYNAFLTGIFPISQFCHPVIRTTIIWNFVPARTEEEALPSV